MTEEKGLAVRSNIISSYDDVVRASLAMAKSGYFQDAHEQAQAIVKILAGQEMGFGPFASMTGIFIIQGRPSIGANLMAAAVKGSGRYDYRIKEMNEKVCDLIFYERTPGGKEELGHSVFTLEDARKAGTKNIDKFPRNMLFARAMSNGVRWYCPDVFSGSPVYTPEELGAETDQDGNVVTATFKEPEPQPANVIQPAPVLNTSSPAQVDVTPPEPSKVEQAARELGGAVTETEYAGAWAKIGKNRYPAAWAKALAGYPNQFEIDGILGKLNLPMTSEAAYVKARVDAYLEDKK